MSELYYNCPKCKKRVNPKTRMCKTCVNSRPVWDGRKHLLLGGQFGTPYFPSGCLPIVARILEQYGVETIYNDQRIIPPFVDPQAAYNLTLYHREPWKQQKDAIHAAIKFGRGIIQSPTASGKTTIMSGILKLLTAPAIVVINNTTIAIQLKQEIEWLLQEEVGLIKQNCFEPRRITIAMTQSLGNLLSLDKVSKKEHTPPFPEALELVKNTRTIILDEAHHGSSDTWYLLCKAMVNAYYRFGITGTAFMRPSGDDLLMMGATGGLLYEVSEKELIDEGLIARPIIHFFKVQKPDDLEDVGNYQTAYQNGVVDNSDLNSAAAKIIKNLWKDSQILVLCERLEHIENICAHLKGVEYEILTGESPDWERESIKQQFISGSVKVIIATKIFDEGVSLSNIDIVIRMALMKTSIKTKQQVGRGQRNKTNKPNLVRIVDFLHNTNHYLREHSLEHYKDYEQLGYQIIIDDQPPTSIAEWEQTEA